MNELLIGIIIGAVVTLVSFLTGVYVGRKQTLVVFREQKDRVTGSKEIVQTIETHPRSGSKKKAKKDFPAPVHYMTPREKEEARRKEKKDARS